jgi:two-component system sensor histidine kinase BaeS
MQRRLTATIAAVVAGALIVVSLVTFLLTVRTARDQTRRELARQAQQVATGVSQEVESAGTGKGRPPGRTAKTLLDALKQPLHLEDESILAVGPGGRMFDIDRPLQPPPLPGGLQPSDLSTTDLLQGRTVSGRRGSIVYAAAPFKTDVIVAGRLVPGLTQAVILTRHPPTGLRQSWIWFLVGSGLALAAAVVAGDRLSRRITGPLKSAELVTRRIAGGDLAAHVTLPQGSDPELVSLAHSINTMAEELARSRGLERQFLLSVSHDLRTPLTSIRGFAEAIADGAAPDSRRAAEVIAAESRRLERLVRDLLDLAKLDAHRFALNVRRVDLAELVADTGEGFLPAAENFGLDLAVEAGEPETMPVSADPERLAQVIANLVENALKYADHRVVVSAAIRAGVPVLWVHDDGPGIAPEDLPRVFERLYTARAAAPPRPTTDRSASTDGPATSHEPPIANRTPNPDGSPSAGRAAGGRQGRQVGSGLGLAIVAELVHAMGGAVRAESPVDERGGTRMVVTLRAWSEISEPSLSS